MLRRIIACVLLDFVTNLDFLFVCLFFGPGSGGLDCPGIALEGTEAFLFSHRLTTGKIKDNMEFLTVFFLFVFVFLIELTSRKSFKLLLIIKLLWRTLFLLLHNATKLER